MKMNGNEIIDEELLEVKQKLVKNIENIELLACHRSLVSVHIIKTKYRDVTVCIQFPNEYPKKCLLIELKSKVFTPALLNHVTGICESELKKYAGRKQIAILVKFLRKFIDDNPLLPCRDELTFAKKNMLKDDADVFKMKSKQGIVTVLATKLKYFLKFTVKVPDNYPIERIELNIESHNFPMVMAYYFISQAREMCRKAVEPPLKKSKNQPEFKPSLHVKKIMEFFICTCTKRFPTEICHICGENALPESPEDVVKDPKQHLYAERIYCGHVYHHGCLDKFMKTPPFGEGKKCHVCKQRIFHDKWNISPMLAEERWAHKEARQRELDEVVDFLT